MNAGITIIAGDRAFHLAGAGYPGNTVKPGEAVKVDALTAAELVSMARARLASEDDMPALVAASRAEVTRQIRASDKGSYRFDQGDKWRPL